MPKKFSQRADSLRRAEALRLLAACLTGAAIVAILWTCSVHRKQVLHAFAIHRHNQTLIIATP